MGQFIGSVQTEWLVEPKSKLPWYKRWTSAVFEWDADRKMKLLVDFGYRDNDGIEWFARKGDIVDGASIPPFFWRFIGPPLTGDYRRSSVIHDVLCQRKIPDSKKVHSLFCEMIEVDDVPLAKRTIMCKAVKWFGPKWTI